METEQLKNLSVRELRKICRENGKRTYAWLTKAELIFLIQDFPEQCGNCARKLNPEEMGRYVEDTETNAGLNWWDEYVPCCADCLEWEIHMCFSCSTFYMYGGLEEAETPDTGETLYICRHCSRCAVCDEHVHNIEKRDWVSCDESNYSLHCKDCAE